MPAEARNVSIEPQHRASLPEMSWEDISEARKESSGASRLVQVSKNPFITTLEARMLCAEHNVTPNF
jgi:hypothetical protein